jgi:hypothetical protein
MFSTKIFNFRVSLGVSEAASVVQDTLRFGFNDCCANSEPASIVRMNNPPNNLRIMALKQRPASNCTVEIAIVDDISRSHQQSRPDVTMALFEPPDPELR